MFNEKQTEWDTSYFNIKNRFTCIGDTEFDSVWFSAPFYILIVVGVR